ncbi:MAG: 3-isopropylmalate dehydrogenase [Lentisphaeria bacterium]|nr:3-isopropylmalate dehydrogenase [Lentisphaeria bacterium]
MGKNYRIAVIPGDGTGPEVVGEAVKVLDAAGRKFGFSAEKTCFKWGAEHYLATGEILPADAADQLRRFDAVLLGAIGDPRVKPGLLEKGILLRLRFELDQYINLRPVKLYPGVETPLANKGPEDINYVVVRENTGGIYTGIGGSAQTGTKDEVATQSMVYTYKQVERCLRFAFETARKRHSRENPWNGLSQEDIAAGKTAQLTLCGKTNVLTHVFGLWERVFKELAPEFPEVKTAYSHVDAITMWMVKNPEWFDVIVTCNIFGDIITDLGAMTQGGMGIASGGNINPAGVSMFEPIGGSAPKYTGKHVINPLAAIGAAGMMLDFLGEKEASSAIDRSMAFVTGNKMESMAAGKMGYSTGEVGDLVVENL